MEYFPIDRTPFLVQPRTRVFSILTELHIALRTLVA